MIVYLRANQVKLQQAPNFGVFSIDQYHNLIYVQVPEYIQSLLGAPRS